MPGALPQPPLRGRGITPTTLAPSAEESAGFLVLDAAIERLAAVDPQAATVVRLRYFAGLSVDETAAALEVSAPTVKRTWAFARGWLREAIENDRS